MKRAILKSAVSASVLMLATSVNAETLAGTASTPAAEEAPAEEIVVTGTIVSGEMKSIAAQREADNIVSVLSADGIGRLPDRNAAEAVQRLPGVAIERDQGEGRFVAVRGLPSQWNSTLINGSRLPTAEEETTSRATAFDFFPSELIDQVIVAKAITPDMEGDAIGGSVNFITKTAPDKRTLQLTAGGNYSEKAAKGGYLASALYGDRLGKFGFVLSGTYFKRQWATDNYEPRRGGDGIGITRLELRDYTGVRETIGINGAMEYAFDDGGKLYARGIYGTLIDDETHYKHRLNFASNRVEVQHIFNTLITELAGGEVGGVHMLGDGAKFDWKVARYENLFRYGDTPDGRDNSYFVVRFDQRGVGYQGLENRGAGTLAYNTIDGGSDPAKAISNHLPSAFRMDPALTRLANVELYKIRVKETDRIVLEGNLTVPAGDGLTFKTGAKYRDKLRDATFEDLFFTWNPAMGPVPTLANFTLMNQPGRGGFLDELAIGSQYSGQFSQVVSEKGLVDWYQANRGNLLFDAAGSATAANGGALGRTFRLTEKHLAGYAMATWEPSESVTLLGGVRLEHTKTTVDGQVLVNGALERERRSNDYLAVLPSLHLTYRLDRDTNIRAAVTRSFARPDFGDLAPGGAFSEADLEFAGGNPGLKPSYAWNADLLFEHYWGNAGVISAGVFFKRISDPIYDSRRIGTYRGIDGVAFLTPDNGKAGDLYGFEFNVQRRLTFLPGPLSNLGVNANYTLIRSNFTLPDGREVRVPRQANNLANVAVYYDDGAFSTRLAMNYKDAFIEEYGSSATSDSYYGAYTSLDLTVNWKVRPSLTLFGEASNLTNQKLHYYLGSKERPLQVEYYGPRFLLGVKAAIF
ncbi:TonB-dependent receptor [Sphingomonas koreensis]|uniref:TonB-dependent receptor n=1 Tax=Sphingomonas koreensis TaxID=93064 RepID=A0A430G4P8_9SPHN|nr:TonB-dependent receptor [Sphingomonas koreensis]RSY86921.1 TonB-dependent receptor [Sphingomonas koreensis]